VNNIENSIRHLQSSIKKRGCKIGDLNKEIAWLKYRILNPDLFNWKEFHKKRLLNYKGVINTLSNQQKIEKKMLAMMYDLQDNKNNSWICSANQLAKSLDEL